jgi:hypothetical protein
LINLDELLKDFRELRKDLPEADALRLKSNNHTNGVQAEKQTIIDKLVKKIHQGTFELENKEIQLKVIDLLTIYSNHLDQHISEKVNPKLPPEVKEKKVLDWLEAAYKISQKLIPEIDRILMENHEEFLTYEPEVLSSVSMLLHYLGKARRYNDKIVVQERLPLLNAALTIAKALQSQRAENPALNDLHYYESRVTTFEMPVVYSLREVGSYDEAAKIIEEQLNQSYSKKNYYHMIQGHVQLSEIAREKYEKYNQGIEVAIEHAQKAISIVQEIALISGEENFTKHCIYFNARTAALKAYKACDENDKARILAEALLSEYENDPNCGAKSWHIEIAKESLETALSLDI